MGAIAVPLLPDQVDNWKQFAADIEGPRREEFADFNRRHGLERHRAWLQRNPDGIHLVIAVHDGPGSDTFMETMSSSEEPFDVWFREGISQAHGIDFSGPLPPPATLEMDGHK